MELASMLAASADTRQVSATPFNYLIFIVAVLFLLLILAAGFWDYTVQRNILYLVVLALSSSMVFAFLPFDASFAYRDLFKAGGTAAIFGFCLYITTDFTAKDYITQKVNADSQITNLNSILKEKE